MASWSFGIEWNDTGLGNYTPRLERAWQLDQVMRMAEERGIKVVLVLLNHGAFSETVNPQWYENPFNLQTAGYSPSPRNLPPTSKLAGSSNSACATSPRAGPLHPA